MGLSARQHARRSPTGDSGAGQDEDVGDVGDEDEDVDDGGADDDDAEDETGDKEGRD